MDLVKDYYSYQSMAKESFMANDITKAMSYSYLANRIKFEVMRNSIESLDEAFENYKKRIKESE